MQGEKVESYGDKLSDNYLETNRRQLSGFVGTLFTVIAIFTSLIHLYILNFHPMEPWVFRSIHLSLASVIGFALFSGWRQRNKSKIHMLDWLAILASVLISFYIWINLSELQFRAGVLPTTSDFIVSLVGVILVLELTRRTSGWALPVLAFIFILYAFIGPYLPGILHHNGYSGERFFSYIYGLNGIFGTTIDVSSKYILLFIIFGSFLVSSKVGNYFVDFSFSIAGGLRGGPAKVAVFSSGLMGMMNGTSTGNVVSTGSLTIPLMKRVGYRPKFASAIEATASTGGQIMPPIMGAGAFIMAEVIGVPYSEIMIAAIIPAILYFVSIYFMIDLEAVKQGLSGLKRSQLPSFKKILKRSYLLIPIIVLFGMLLSGYSIVRSGTVTIITCLVVSWFSKYSRMGLKATLLALENGAKNAVQLIAVCACAGIIVGVIALTGIGQRVSNILLGVADGNILLALFFAMIIAIILGMGMPTTAAYAIVASVVAPGLVQIGFEPIIAHMFVFYYAVISAITPPVAVAAFAAAGIGGTDPMKTSLQAFRLGIAAYIVPFMFVYSTPLLMMGSAMEITLGVITSLIGIYLLAAAVQGYFFGYIHWLQRIVLLGASLLLINATLFWDVIGLCLILLSFIIGKFLSATEPEKTVPKN